eukprot:1638760-Prymnesium_polylepis.1
MADLRRVLQYSRKRKPSRGGPPPPLAGHTTKMFEVSSTGSDVYVDPEMLSSLQEYAIRDSAVSTCIDFITRHVLEGGLEWRSASGSQAPEKWQFVESDFENVAREVIKCRYVFGFAMVVCEQRAPLDTVNLAVREGATVKHGLLPYVPDTVDVEVVGVRNVNGLSLSYELRDAKMRSSLDNSFVSLATRPTHNGMPVSTVSSVYEDGVAMLALQDAAVDAEQFLSRPSIVTQERPKHLHQLGPSELFFDSESTALNAASENSEEAQRARLLQLQLQLCASINKIQTRSGDDGEKKQRATKSMPDRNVFVVPRGMEAVTAGGNPAPRGDLVELKRFHRNAVALAFGLPASVTQQANAR